MNFNHNLLPRTELESETTDSGRYYTTPVGTLPSVTTVLGRRMDNSWLAAWKAKVGEESAKQISTKAANRGTSVHAILDKYVSNDPTYAKKTMPVNLAMFRSGQSILDANIKQVFGIELPLYSKTLNTAGKTDLVCNWDGINTVLDYKTSKKIKTEDQILNYFLQATAYSLMANELYELNITQFVVLIFVDFEKPQLFVKQVSEYEQETRNIFA